MKKLLLLLVVSSLCMGSSHAAFTSVADTRSSDLFVLDAGDLYLRVGYYAWGPGWSGVSRKSTAKESVKRAEFSIENVLQKTDVPFVITGSWTRPEKDRMVFDATLEPGGTSELNQAQFSLTVGSTFSGTEAVVTLADGSSKIVPVTFGRGMLGDSVVKIELRDKAGRATEIDFASPTYITTDGGDIRIAIAHDRIEKGKKQKLGFSIKLPATVEFIPGEKSAARFSDLSGWYRFEPQDQFPENSEWDLSSWQEAPAGKHGRIERHGDQLVYNEKPIKLWGINNSFGSCAPDNALADKRAKFYAAMGINAIRLHKYADGTGWAGILTKESATEYDPARLDDMDYYVAALKKRGIYTKLSPVFIIDIGPGDRDKVPYMDELGTMKGDRINPRHGSLYISTELQDLLIKQVTTLLRHTNAYTGLTYAKDPAIAYVELYNEDCTLFGGIAGVMKTSPTLRARGGALFSVWLKEKYKTEEAFLAAWGKGAVNNGMLTNQGLPLDESWAGDRIYPAGNPWFFDPTNLNGSQLSIQRRLLDTMAFLYELQNKVYARYTAAIRATGYTGEIISSNWHAGRMMSHFYNLHSDSLNGTIDRHNYFGGGIRGTMAIHSGSMLASPGSGTLSSSLNQVEGHPFMLSEWIHVLPNEWGSEGPAIIGAYGMGLQGWDVSFAFGNTDNGAFSSAIGLSEWDATAPQFLGMFPAVSRQVLRGDVRESNVVHERNVHMASLDEQKIGFEEMTTQQWDVKTFTSDVFPSEALAVAKSVVKFTEEFEPTETFDLSAYEKDGFLVSSTDQLRWLAGKNPMDGHIEIDTPGTQAIVGFANGQKTDFNDAVIMPRSRYAAIYLSAQSQAGTLATDKGILLTAMARARNEKSIVIADSLLISRGDIHHHKPTGPVVMEPVVASIALKRKGVFKVHILDHTGVKTGRTVPVKNGGFTIDTSRDGTPYYLISY